MVKTLVRILTIFTVLVSSLSFSTYQAQARPATGITDVILGDSMFANPTYTQLQDRIGMLNPYSGEGKPGKPSPQGCPQGAHTIASEMSRITGDRVINYACSGTSAASPSTRFSFQSQVDKAIANGDIQKARNVIIMMGINDGIKYFYNPRIARDGIQAEVAKKIRDIKRVNPHANITVSSYPAIATGEGLVCPVRIIPTRNTHGVPLDFGALKHIENNVNYGLYQATVRTNTFFYDLNKATRYHSMCAPNNQRWIAGTMDTTKAHNFAGHLTHNGITQIAYLLANHALR